MGGTRVQAVQGLSLKAEAMRKSLCEKRITVQALPARVSGLHTKR